MIKFVGLLQNFSAKILTLIVGLGVMSPDLLVQIGIHLPDLFAGLAGGVLNAIALRRTNPWAFLGSMVSGSLMANYLADTFSQFLGGKPGFAGFCIGVAGTGIAQGIIEASKAWKPFASRENGSNVK